MKLKAEHGFRLHAISELRPADLYFASADSFAPEVVDLKQFRAGIQPSQLTEEVFRVRVCLP